MQEEQLQKSEINALMELFSNGKFDEALNSASKLNKSFPENSMLHNIIGACYSNINDLESAIKSYEKAIAINPTYSKAHYNLAAAFHDQGLLDDSANSYQDSIKIDPSFAEAHNNLGNVFRELSELDKAIVSYEKAISIKPDYVAAHFSLSNAFFDIGQFDRMIDHLKATINLKPNFAEAYNSLGIAYENQNRLIDSLESYEKATEIYPDFAEAFNNLGNIQKDLGKVNDAINSYQRALEIHSDYPSFHNNLGNAFKELGRLDDALGSYKNALRYNPDYAVSHNNIGLIFFELKQFEKAIKSYQKALNADRNFADAHNNLGVVFNKIGRFDDAISSYKNAISIRPNFADTYNNLGVLYKKLGQFNDAINSYENALEINYDDADTHNNLGIVLFELEYFDDAISSYNNAIKIQPNLAEAFNNLGHVYSQLNDYVKAIESYERGYQINKDLDYILGNILSSKMNSCNWIDLSSLISIVKNSLIETNRKIIDPFSFMGLIDEPELLLKATEIRVNSDHPKLHILPKINHYAKHTKIRIGYFSGDFREHPVGYLTVGLYEAHDSDLFEIHAFSYSPDTNDVINLRIKEGVDCFHDVHSMTPKEIALLARSLEIDIAVDLAGLTAKSKTDVFAISAAPIQISYIGYVGTMGADYYDYLIADKIMIPKKYQKHYKEKIVYLPNFQVNDSKDLPPNITLTRKDVGLPEKGFVFCCFNNTYKFTPNTFDSWSKILKAVDNSVLIVFTNNELSKTNLTNEILQRGIEPRRLIFGDSMARPKYMARYRVADLFLDTQPYNAGTTASDALRMGLPVLTMMGESYQARMGASILYSLNLPELITNTTKEYESLAINLATNPKKLKLIKDKLVSNLSTAPLFNTQLFTKNIELAYVEMNERKYKGLEADHIYIE